MVKLAIDFENPGREWWENGGQELWEAILEGFDNNAVVVEAALAQSWLEQAAQLPGWEGGPDSLLWYTLGQNRNPRCTSVYSEKNGTPRWPHGEHPRKSEDE